HRARPSHRNAASLVERLVRIDAVPFAFAGIGGDEPFLWMLLRIRRVGDQLARHDDKRRVRDHPEVRPHAHPLYLPMTKQRLEAFDLAEIAASLNRLKRVLK